MNADENNLHKQFAELRVNGEWFRKADDLLAFIQSSARIYDPRLFS
jgi:hypothetical protein